MLKLLVILALSVYILSKIGSFFFRVGAASQRNHQQRREGSVNVDSNQKNGKKGTIKGGDYVDFEEVK